MQTCRRTCFTPGGAFPGTEKTSRNCGFSEKMTYIYTLNRCTMLKLKPTLFLLAVLSLFSDRVSAAIEFRTLSVNEGLSQSTVLAIAQDGMGRIWMGTQDGLNCYDGYSFTVFRHVEGDARAWATTRSMRSSPTGVCSGSAPRRDCRVTMRRRSRSKISASRGATCRSPTSPPRPAAT